MANSIIQNIQSRVLFLGLSLPNNISCHWNIPLASYINVHPTITVHQGWRLSICSSRHLIIGILWKENDHPIEGAIHSCLDFYPGIFCLIQLVPAHLSSFLTEADSSLSKILRHPHKSP